MLRTRLMSGLGCLLLILLAMGLYSIDQCSELGRRIHKVASESDATGRDIRQMKRASADMTAALLSLTTGNGETSRKDFQKASASFHEAIGRETDRTGISNKEESLILQLNRDYETYNRTAQGFLGMSETGAAWKNDAHALGLDGTQLLDRIEQLNTEHEDAISSSTTGASDDIDRTVNLLRLLMLIALVATALGWFGISRWLLNPLRSLTSSIKQIGEGNLDQKLVVQSGDELGTLAFSFNQMAAQLRVYQSNTSVELLRLNETIRTTLASFPDPVFVLNSDGAVEFRNPAADHLALKLLFAGVTRLPAKVDEKVEQVRASGQDYLPTAFAEAIKFHFDGLDRYYLPRIVLLRTDKGETFGVAVILDNVTRMLLLDDVKSNLIATVSHELKTPLTSVRMALYLLYEKTVGELNDKQHDLVSAAKEDADRLLRTLNDLLDLAKFEHGSVPLAMRPTPPAELVSAAERATREPALAAGTRVEMEVARGLPNVMVDGQRLAYVFGNLITNAIKYSPAGTRIIVRAQPGQTRTGIPSVRFSVKDEGPGIGPEHQEHIFERFYRIPGTNKTGAGLGLSIAREIVVAHGGEIGTISQREHGSEFFFLIPCETEKVDVPPSARSGADALTAEKTS